MIGARFACGLAVLCGLASLLLGVLPNPGTAVIVEPSRRVDCGTIFRENEWSGDDGCEGDVLARAGMSIFLFLLAIVFAGVGVALLWRASRYG